MDLIKADHQRTLQLTGVPDPVSRPVDIDREQSGFSILRSLRIYCFETGWIIDGHAEEDEVLIVILSGSVQLTLSPHEVEQDSSQFCLTAVDNSDGGPCVAYLPPNGAYRLVPLTISEVAYARATTSIVREPRVFGPKASTWRSKQTLFEMTDYPAHLRLRVLRFHVTQELVTFSPIKDSEAAFEALIHVRSEPEHEVVAISVAKAQPLALVSWDTICVQPGERPTLHIAPNSSALFLVMFASN